MANQDDRSACIVNRALRVIDFHLRYCSLKIEANHASPHSSSNSDNNNNSDYDQDYATSFYQLATRTPFVSFKQLVDDISHGRCISWCLVCILRLYIIGHFWLVASFHYDYDQQKNKIWPLTDVQPGQVCSNRTDTIGQSDEYKKYIEVENWIYYFGAMLPGLRGVSLIGYVLAASSSVCYDFLGPIGLHFHKQRADIYGFIVDKERERNKFVSNLSSLVDNLFVCEQIANSSGGKTVLNYKARARLGDPFHYLTGYLRRGTSYGRNLGRLLNQETPLASDSFTISSEKKLHELIIPAHLSDWWHEKICFVAANLTRIGFVLSVMVGTFFLIISLVMEIGRRLDYRLKLFDCLSKNQSISLTHLAPMRLAALESEAQMDAYRSYDGSMPGTILLHLIEAKLFLTWSIINVMLHIMSILIGGAISLPLYIGLYMSQYISKMLWLKEVRIEINGCIDALIEALVEPKIGKRTMTTMSKRRRDKILRLLTVAYLNFELYRREQKSYQSLANFLVGQMTLMNAQSLLVSYLACAVLRNGDDRINIALATYVFAMLNIYLITSAIRTNVALKTMKDITRMVAFIASQSLERSFVANLWSLQMLSHQETLSCFAPKLFGISITFDKIVTLNIYLVGLWYLALRA